MVVKPPASRQPAGIARPNYSSALLNGVTHLVLGNSPFNLINQRPLTVSSTPPVYTATQNGIGPKFNGASGYWYTSAGTAALINARNPWTYAAIVRLTANTASSGWSIAMIENSTPGNSTADRAICVHLGAFTGYAFDGAAKSAVGTTVANPMQDYVVVVTCGGGFIKTYVDGREEASTAVSNNGFAGYGTPLLVMGYGDIDVAAPLSGAAIVPLLLKTDNVYWRPAQVARFYRNPWEVVDGIPRRVSVSVPSGNNTIAVPAGSLTLTGQTPTVIAGSNTVAVPLGTLSLTGQVPTVTVSSNNIITFDDAGILTLGLFTPTVVLTGGNTIAVPAGSLSLTGFAPTVVQSGNNTVAVPAGTLTLSGQTPTVTASDQKVIAVPAGSLTLTGFAPTVTASSGGSPQTISVPAGSLTLTGFAPVIVQTANNVVQVPAGTLTLTGQTPTVTATANNVVDVPLGTLTLSPFAPVVTNQTAVAATVAVVGGGPAPRRRKPHFVEIDGELFPVEDEAEAIAVLRQAQELHAEVVQKAVVQKVVPAKPVLKASPVLKAAVEQAQLEMNARHAEIERAYQQMLDDDDEDVLFFL